MFASYMIWILLASPFLLVLAIAWAVSRPPALVIAVVPVSFLWGLGVALFYSSDSVPLLSFFLALLVLDCLLALIVWFSPIFRNWRDAMIFGALQASLAGHLGMVTMYELGADAGWWMLSGLINIAVMTSVLSVTFVPIVVLRPQIKKPVTEVEGSSNINQFEQSSK